jgi:hypothetical protein
MGEREKVAHLLRRATFGPTAEEVDAAERAGYSATVDRLTNPEGLDTAPAAPALAGLAKEQQIQRLTEWWLDRMVATSAQYPETDLLLAWALGDELREGRLRTAHAHAARRLPPPRQGDFAVFVKAMLRDAALVLWLDGQKNTKKAPNENLAAN